MKYENEVKDMIQLGRDFLQGIKEDEGYLSDQAKRLPQPPLVKDPMREESISLPTNFEDLDIINDFLQIINTRVSSRVYTEENMTLLQLSYLLWCTQGIKDIRGKKYATLRTVPSAGARHPFECYLAIKNVEGLKPGLYHYLPMKHALEFLKEVEDLEAFMSKTVSEQKWVKKANVMFYFSFVAYRGEWRYGVSSHRVALMDAGHVTENLYLACTSIRLGSCAIGGVDAFMDEVFELDGKEEYMFYAQSVGTIKAEDIVKEKAFYKFVEDEGL